MIYVLYGLEKYLINNYIEELKNKNKIEDFNIITYDLDDGINNILEDANTLSMFGNKKMIIVNNSYMFTSVKQEIDSDSFYKYIDNPNPDCLLIFIVNNEKLDERKKITKQIKKTAIVKDFNTFDNNTIKKSIALENDDKIYNILDVLSICKEIEVPFVFDYHHYKCNNNGENYLDYIDEIFKTWKNLTPKIHFSSPKNNTKKEYRSHSDYIDYNEFIKFLEQVKKYNKNIDIMLEAKAKDEAVFRLIRQLKYKTNYKFIDDTSFLV